VTDTGGSYTERFPGNGLAMKIDELIVSRVAELARLELSDEEKAEFARQLSEIIGYVKKINELDTDFAEIEDAVSGRGNALREDAPRESLPREDVEKMAPEFGDGHVVVPRILGER